MTRRAGTDVKVIISLREKYLSARRNGRGSDLFRGAADLAAHGRRARDAIVTGTARRRLSRKVLVRQAVSCADRVHRRRVGSRASSTLTLRLVCQRAETIAIEREDRAWAGCASPTSGASRDRRGGAQLHDRLARLRSGPPPGGHALRAKAGKSDRQAPDAQGGRIERRAGSASRAPVARKQPAAPPRKPCNERLLRISHDRLAR